MFKIHKAVQKAKIGKSGPAFWKTAAAANQRGSILMGIIITMVVMATLGAGMVYLTTTSTFQELLANNHARAYYAAESGGRHANALIRQAVATGSQTVFNALTDEISETVYTLANGDQFKITYWTPTLVGGSMKVTYDAIGTVGSGFLQAKVRLRYQINPANQGSGGGAGGGGGEGGGTNPPSPALPRPASDFDIPKQDLDIYYSPVDMSQVDIKDNPFVDSDRALNLKADYYIMGLKWYDNPAMLQLDQIRTANSGLLNYRAQVKIKVNNDRASKFNMYNIIGISFRLDDTNTSDMTTNTIYPDAYGLSFVKLPGPRDPNINASLYKNPNPPDWFVNVIYPEASWDPVSDNTWYAVLWKRAVSSTGSHKVLAYRQLTSADWVCEMVDGFCNIKPWSTLYVDVEERLGTGAVDGDGFTYTAGDRYNVIKAYLQSNSVGSDGMPPTPPGPYFRSTTSTPRDIWWEDDPSNPKFKPINWTWVGLGAAAGTSANVIADASLNTLNYSSYNAGTTIKSREIGLHIYNIQTNAQTVFYDNFYIDLSPSLPPGTDGFVDGTGEVIQAP